MRTMSYIDSWIVGRFERFSHWTQKTWGWDSVTWLRIMRTAEVAALVRQIMAGSPYKYAYWVIIGLCALDIITEGIKHLAGSGLANRRKHEPFCQVQRLAGVVIMCCVVYGDVKTLNFWFEFSNIANYFGAVEDLPPGVSRLRKFVESLTQQREMLAVKD